MSQASKPTVIYLHIPKTGGTTVHAICEHQYSPAEYCYLDHQPDIYTMSEAERMAIRFLRGSFWFGIHEQVSSPFTYITLLRDPVKRVVSLYDYTRQIAEHNMHPVTTQYTLPEIYARKLHKEALDNGQTRRISGVWDQVPHGKIDEEIFSLAKQNLIDHFSVVGVTERFNETLLLIQELTGWRSITYVKQNTARDVQAKKTVLTAAEKEQIASYNHWDQQLYHFASELLDTAVAQRGEPFQKRLASFETQNIFSWHNIYWGVIRKVSVRTMARELWQEGRISWPF